MATNDDGLEDAPTKYDSVNDALKMTEPEYRNLRHDAINVIVESDNHTPVRPDKSEAKHTVRGWANDHDIFQRDNIDGATLGAIVEFSAIESSKLTRWQIEMTGEKALIEMAKEALVLDAVNEWMDLTTKYRTDKD